MAFHSHLFLAALEGATLTAVLALTAVGLSLVFGVMRIVNVAHGEFYMLGAVLTWGVMNLFTGVHPGLGFGIALMVAPLIVGGIAIVADRLILRKLHYEPDATIVATIGLLYIIQQMTLLIYGPHARAIVPPFQFTVSLPGFGYSGYKLMVIVFSILVLLAVWFMMARTRLGLMMRATQYDREIAQSFGIPIDKIYMFVLAFGAGLAALGAVLILPTQQAHYLMGTEPLLLSFIIVIIGGLGSLRGTVVAAVLVGMSDGIISVFFSPTLAKMIATFAVAMVLVYRPQGLFGSKRFA